LTEAGFAVRPSEIPHDGRVQLAGDDAVWLLTVSDRGEADLVRWPTDAGSPDPRRLADLAATLLTGRPGTSAAPGTAAAHPELRVNGVAGMELRDRGFTVELKIYSDQVCFDVLSEIQATNPSGADAD